jgi:hypothetical protein
MPQHAVALFAITTREGFGRDQIPLLLREADGKPLTLSESCFGGTANGQPDGNNSIVPIRIRLPLKNLPAAVMRMESYLPGFSAATFIACRPR